MRFILFKWQDINDTPFLLLFLLLLSRCITRDLRDAHTTKKHEGMAGMFNQPGKTSTEIPRRR
jgi:hypothetical protein